jgi:hypothetical protein
MANGIQTVWITVPILSLHLVAETSASGDFYMPRAKTNPDQASDPGAASGSVSKMSAVRQALAALGFEAKPPAIDRFIQDSFSLSIPHNMISSYKSQLKAEAKKKGKRRGRPPGSGAAAAVEAGSKPAIGGNVSWKDLEEVKSLTGRLGKEKLRKLVDFFG